MRGGLALAQAERHRPRADRAVGDADGGHHGQPLAGLVELEHAADVDAERGGRRPHRLGQQLAQVVALEREAAERRDRVLLAGAARELLRGVGALGDVAGDDEQRLDVPSSARTGTAWTANVRPSLTNSNARRSPCSAAR